MKHRVIKVWQPDIARFKFYVQEKYYGGLWGNKLKWQTLAWDISEENAIKNAEQYQVNIEEVESIWG